MKLENIPGKAVVERKSTVPLASTAYEIGGAEWVGNPSLLA
jgi:hypothetical protein